MVEATQLNVIFPTFKISILLRTILTHLEQNDNMSIKFSNPYYYDYRINISNIIFIEYVKKYGVRGKLHYSYKPFTIVFHDLTIRRKKSRTFFNPIKVVRKQKGFSQCAITINIARSHSKQLQFLKMIS